MSDEITFYRVAQNNRVQINGMREKGDILRAVIYIDTAYHLAQTFKVEGCPVAPNVRAADVKQEDVLPALFELERLMASIYARNIYILDHNLAHDVITLDDAWQAKASSMLEHVKQLVRDANLDVPAHERIMSAITRLQGEIDLKRTRLQSSLDAFVAICAAVGSGSKKLKPAAELLERVIGAFSIVQVEQRTTEKQAQLPPPDKYLSNGEADQGGQDKKAKS